MEKKEQEPASLVIKLPKEIKEILHRAAILGGYRTLTEFLISSALEKARTILPERDFHS